MQRHSYRLYIYGKNGDLIGPAMALNFDDDEGAIAEASQRVNGYSAELRDEQRLVMKFEPKESPT
jgi:hypothetical protein